MLSSDDKIRAFDKLWYSSLVGIAIVTEEGHFRAANEAFCEIVEHTEYALQQMSIQDITHPQDVDSVNEMSRRVASNNLREFTMKIRYIKKTGAAVWCALRVVPVRNDSGNLEFFVEQVSEIIDIATDKMPASYPTATEAVKKTRIRDAVQKFWPIIAAGITACAMVAAEIIRQFR